MEPRRYKTISKNSYDFRKAFVEMDETSYTVPDQALSLRQILTMFGNGVPPNGVDMSSKAMYDGEFEDDIDEVSPFNAQDVDLLDQYNYEQEYQRLSERLKEPPRGDQKTIASDKEVARDGESEVFEVPTGERPL